MPSAHAPSTWTPRNTTADRHSPVTCLFSFLQRWPLIQALIQAGIPYDLQIYPRKTHSIAGPDVRTHLYNRILAQFEQYLKAPPAQNHVAAVTLS